QNAAERIAAVTLLAEIHDSSVLEVLAEAARHPAADVRDIAADALAEAKDLRALPAIMDALRYKRYDRINVSTLAKLGDAAVPILVKMLRDPAQGEHVRTCIASALEDVRNDEAVEALHELMHSPEPELRIQAVKSLAGEPRALPWILEATRDSETHWAALKSLSHYRGPEIVAVLVDALKHPGVGLRQVAAEGLVEMSDASAIPALLEALRDEDDWVRTRAREALAKVIDPSLIPALFQILEETPHKRVVTDLLIQLKSDVVVNRMVALLKSQDIDLRATAAHTLGHLDDRVAIPALLLSLKDEEEKVRELSAFAMGHLKDPGAVPDLIAIARNQDEFDDVRRAAAMALYEIGTREARIAYKEWERQDKEN
ncbi:MAG: HEAT repeat domain-containing protein, partial [Alloacidobacterium sp.]